MVNLLPPNSTTLEKALAQTMAPELDPSADLIRTLWNPETCPLQLLPWLAWALSVDLWDESWSEEVKRAAVAGSIAWHRKKGTPWAVKQVLASIGFPDSQIIEHRILHQAWLQAGGELLDGVGFLDGSGDLSPPPGDFRFATNHWAEFAVKLNVGEQAWIDTRQAEIRAICRAYGPARSHLVAIILSSLHSFDSTIRMRGFKAKGKVVFDGCRRVVVAGFDTLDGCDILGGDSVPNLLDGSGVLDGSSNLIPWTATGEPLDGGQLAIRESIRIPMQAGHLGGNRAEAPEVLCGGMLLDGLYTISGPLLDGLDALDGQGDLSYPLLLTPDDCLDGTSNLGEMPGPDMPWFSGMMRVRRGAQVIQEPI